MKFVRIAVCFRRLFFALGESDVDEIRIDLKRNTNPIRTYLHEQLHLKHPDWKEWRVLREERRVWKRLTHKQIHQIGRRLFNRKFKEDEE